MGSADTGAREPREVLRDYILSVPLAATDDDGSKKADAMKALAALAAGVGVPPDKARVAEIRQENAGGDVSYRDIAWLCDEVERLVRALAGVGEARPAEPEKKS